MTTDEPKEKLDPEERRRPRRLSDAQNEEVVFPLAWIIIGGLAALVVIGLLGIGIVNIFRQGTTSTPTPAVLPPLVETVNTPVPADTATAVPTPVVAEEPATNPDAPTSNGDTAAPQPEENNPAPANTGGDITINGFVRVVGTEGVGVSLRAGPGRNNARVGIAEENEAITLLVLDGPRPDENLEDFIWWFIRHPDGSEGWVVQDFIVAVADQ